MEACWVVSRFGRRMSDSIHCMMHVQQMREKNASHHKLTVEQVNHAVRANTVGSGGSKFDGRDCT